MPTTPMPVCDMCDAHKDDTSGNFRVLPPVFQSYGGAVSFSGPVCTVRCFEDNSLAKDALNSPGEGRVLVVDAGASLRRAVFGGNMGLAAVKNGWAGVVINGAVRDVADLRSMPLGILALALMPWPASKQNRGEREVPVEVHGVWIRPGEWLYADEDGVVINTGPLT